ncbi:hypothetical protein HPP92_020961 [Vanilla planifolia]|uniref:F-box domain-containing protein n=1 Tax=Vanilla planifolia TaxID=51239 RepID=A0A835PY10_VANPL|nr:hypothetical protein HPP92_021281 [Vanilla planifolia]KAG0462485.1 hypothetical protein HPP92_020961 [Vanilla planifolia]
MGTVQGEGEHDKARGYHINDNADLLAEILARLDGRSLAAAASVCCLWRAVSSKESVWEALCNRHVSYASNGTRAVVAALGGYRRLYCRCVGPIADRLLVTGRETGPTAAVRLSLSMSLFSIDCYERLVVGGRQSPSSLLFLRNTVDVS